MNFRLLLLLLGLSSSAYPQQASLPADVIETIHSRIENGVYPSLVIGIIDEKGPHYYSFGTKTIGGKPVDEHTIYEIGSVSKVFTATLLADGITKGRLKADDPIEKYLPAEVKVPTYNGLHITLGHLSDHTSSLPRLPDNMAPADPGNPYADYTVEQMYAFLSSYTLPRAIGSEYEYSNYAVGLLGHILSLEAGKPYEKLLSEIITSPLGMNETEITLTKKMKEKLATGYDQGMKVENWDLTTLAGAGAIRSTASDMLTFLSAEIGYTETTLQTAMELTQKLRHQKAQGNGLGLGWHMLPASEYKIFWHNGGTGGYRSFAGFVKETGTGVVVLTNSTASVDDIGFHLLDSGIPMDVLLPSLATQLRTIIANDGAGKLMEKYTQLKASSPGKYDINEAEINSLGYQYLGQNNIKAALGLFSINVSEFPTSANVYDSYGEALMKDGQKEAAIENYKKSLGLNPGNTNAIDMLAKMGVEYKVHEIQLDVATLESYTGTYQLAPGFNIVFTREGTQLYGQATGQSRFEIYPKSATEFYLKVVDAQIVFSKDDSGAQMMTLYQNGVVMPGKKQ